MSYDDIVDFLRDYAAGDRGMREEYVVRRFNEAADEIERLRDDKNTVRDAIAEIEELRRELRLASDMLRKG